jgi:phosphoribosylanthranilate isomerase
MNFLVRIKLGNVTNLSDARYAAAAGIDYLGFCFDTKNPNYIPPVRAKEMIEWTTGSHIVAEFGDQSMDEVRTISEALQVDAIEVNNHLLPDELKELDRAIIKKIDLAAFDRDGLHKEFDAYKNVADVFHLYSSAEQFDENILLALCQQYKIIWGLPVTTGTILRIIDTFNPYAIHISGGIEEKTGIRDFDELNELIEAVRTEE